MQSIWLERPIYCMKVTRCVNGVFGVGVEPAHLAALEPKSSGFAITPPDRNDGLYQF